MNRLYFFAMALFLVGCATSSSDEGEEAQILHEPLSQYLAENHEKEIKSYLQSVLKDPDSLKSFKILTEPRKGSMNYGAFKVGPTGKRFSNPMWYVCAEYNAKNSYGGYVCTKRHVFFFYQNVVSASMEDMDGRADDMGLTNYSCR